MVKCSRRCSMRWSSGASGDMEGNTLRFQPGIGAHKPKRKLDVNNKTGLRLGLGKQGPPAVDN